MMITTTTLTIMALAVVVGFMCIGSSSGDHVDTCAWLVSNGCDGDNSGGGSAAFGFSGGSSAMVEVVMFS